MSGFGAAANGLKQARLDFVIKFDSWFSSNLVYVGFHQSFATEKQHQHLLQQRRCRGSATAQRLEQSSHGRLLLEPQHHHHHLHHHHHHHCPDETTHICADRARPPVDLHIPIDHFYLIQAVLSLAMPWTKNTTVDAHLDNETQLQLP